MSALPFDCDEMKAARQNLAGIVRRTPLLEGCDLVAGRTLHMKAENLQLTHAFKFRGAYNRASALGEEERKRGVIAASSGNHALGLSLAGAMLDVRVTVVMPEGAPVVKEKGCRRYGACVLREGETYDDSVEYAFDLAQKHGYTYVQSFDDPVVAAGQATVTWEIIEDMPDLDVLVLPIGGGGLITGALGFLHCGGVEIPGRSAPLDGVKVVGVQAEGAASMIRSVSSGRRLPMERISTIADGIAVRQPGELTYATVSEWVDELVTVTDDEMLEMVGMLAVAEKLIAEPAGAAAAAALALGRGDVLSRVKRDGLKAACVLSGGNIEPDLLSRAIKMVRLRGGSLKK